MGSTLKPFSGDLESTHSHTHYCSTHDSEGIVIIIMLLVYFVSPGADFVRLDGVKDLPGEFFIGASQWRDSVRV